MFQPVFIFNYIIIYYIIYLTSKKMLSILIFINMTPSTFVALIKTSMYKYFMHKLYLTKIAVSKLITQLRNSSYLLNINRCYSCTVIKPFNEAAQQLSFYLIHLHTKQRLKALSIQLQLWLEFLYLHPYTWKQIHRLGISQ